MNQVSGRHLFGAAVLGVGVALALVQLGVSNLAGSERPASAQLTTSDIGVWTSAGPSSLSPTSSPTFVTGRATAIAADPANQNHWLAGAALGGVWETGDAGVNWQPRTDGQPSLAMGAIAFSPSSPNVVYAGTGEANFSLWAYAGAGMLRSEDAGATWSVVNTATFARASVKNIIVHPGDPNIVVAGTARGYAGRDLGPVTSPPVFGIYRSTDGGRTWTHQLTGQVSSLLSHTSDFNRQYTVIGDPVGTPNGNSNGDVQTGTMPNALYRTSDGGNRWTVVTGPWTRPDGAQYSSGYIALAIAPSNPEVMYAGVQRPSGSGATELLGLYRTNNAWAEAPDWVQIPMTMQSGSVAGYCDQCSYANVLTVDPTDPDTLFAGGLQIWRCRNCGATPTWQQVTGGPQGDVHTDHHGFAWVGSRLIVVNDGGVFSSIDRGATWKDHNRNLPIVQFFSGAVHPTRTDLILGNTQDNLLTKGAGAVPWERLFSALGVAEGQVVMSTRNPDTDWIINHTYRNVSRSTNGGRSFEQVQGSLDYRAPYTNLPYQPTIRKCPDNDDVVFVGANRLWRANDFFTGRAPSWEVNAPDFDVTGCTRPGRPPAACVLVQAIAFPRSDGASCNTYAYGTGGGFMRLTSNGGASWSDFDPADGVPNRAVTGMAFAKDPNVAYVTLSGYDEATPPGRPGHVFRTTNALAASPTWTNVTPPVNIPFDAILVDPSIPNTVYAGADNGVWVSRDAGTKWAYMGVESGLPNTAVFDLQMQASTGKLYAFTFGRGAYVLTPAIAAAQPHR